jgi:hypothetical protein
VPRVLDAAQDVDAPVLGRFRGELDAPHRDPHLDLIAEGSELSLGLEHEVRAQVDEIGTGGIAEADAAEARSRALDDRAILLHAEWVDGKDDGLMGVDKGCQDELYVVVTIDLVAVGVRRVWRSVPLIRSDAEVDGLR